MSETGHIYLGGSSWAYNFVETPLASESNPGGIINYGKLWTPQPNIDPEYLGKLYYTNKLYDIGKFKFTKTDPNTSSQNLSTVIRSVSIWYPIPVGVSGFYYNFIKNFSAPAGSTWNFQMYCLISRLQWLGGSQKPYLRFKLFKNNILFLTVTKQITSLTFYLLTTSKKTGLTINNGDQLKGQLHMGYFDTIIN